jgi:hypothetical protein
MPAPYDYSIGDVPNPAQSFLQGIQAVDVLRKREQDMAAAQAAQQQLQQRQMFMQKFMGKIADQSVTASDYQQMMVIDPANYQALKAGLDAKTTQEKETAFSNMLPVYSSLFLGKPETATKLIDTQIAAAENVGDTAKVQQAKQIRDLLATPEGQQQLIVQTGATLNGIDSKRFGEIQDNLNTQASAGATKRKAEAEAREAEIKLQRLDAMQEAELRKATSAADEQEIKAKFAERREKAELALKNAQAAQASQATANLTEQGKLLKLDFEAATKGLPLPSKGGGTTTVGAATEDERKAAGWLAQATNAYDNMLKSMYTKEGKPTGAEKPGLIESVAVEPLKGFARSAERQQFVQASSSLSEALLRAATGAGVNKDEAAQKVAELTPTYSDSEETRKQKLAAIPMYLRSLQERAGRAAPKNYQVPTKQNLNITVDY